ncbi:hypothetical protein DUNSADRAFT_10314 [Dunaliella salina]|nr:hypothetical protein DUNSADRAFT_10314 [Dunaliella salina]|eukprot:KAF5833381.1 hypothetical protein DUNSADRAFT_10314 [Dunaliella salina]
MDANTNGAPSTSNDDNSELAQASRSGMAASKAAVGGTLQPIKLRVFLDHSMLEAFTSTGQVLTTRVYHHEVEDHPLDLFERAAAAAKATSRPKSPAYQAREPTPEGTLASMQANNSPPADRQEKSPEPEVVTSTGPTEVVYADEAREKSPAAAQEESSPESIPLAGRARSPSEASEGSPNNGAPDLPPSLELAAFGVDSGMSGVAGYKLAPIWQEDKITDDMEARARENFSKAGTRQQQQQQQQQQQVAA